MKSLKDLSPNKQPEYEKIMELHRSLIVLNGTTMIFLVALHDTIDILSGELSDKGKGTLSELWQIYAKNIQQVINRQEKFDTAFTELETKIYEKLESS